jgi:hypothetical protein
LDWWARACALTPRSPGNQAELQDPATPEGQDDYRAQHHREEQCYGQRQPTTERQKVQLDALEILQDETRITSKVTTPTTSAVQAR